MELQRLFRRWSAGMNVGVDTLLPCRRGIIRLS
jgi:hypothetical protein